MDFATMEDKLRAGKYPTLDALSADFRLICSNCMEYNPEDSDYYKEAASLLAVGNRLIEAEAARQQREQEVALARKASRMSSAPPNADPSDGCAAAATGQPVAGSKRARDTPPPAAASLVRRESGGRAAKAVASAFVASGVDSSEDEDAVAEQAPGKSASRPAKVRRSKGSEAVPPSAGSASGAGPHAASSKRRATAAKDDDDSSGGNSSASGDGAGGGALVVQRVLRGVTVHVGIPFHRHGHSGGRRGDADGDSDAAPALPLAPPLPEDFDADEDAWVCAVCDDGSADSLGNALVQCGACEVVVHQVRWPPRELIPHGMGWCTMLPEAAPALLIVTPLPLPVRRSSATA